MVIAYLYVLHITVKISRQYIFYYKIRISCKKMISGCQINGVHQLSQLIYGKRYIILNFYCTVTFIYFPSLRLADLIVDQFDKLNFNRTKKTK